MSSALSPTQTMGGSANEKLAIVAGPSAWNLHLQQRSILGPAVIAATGGLAGFGLLAPAVPASAALGADEKSALTDGIDPADPAAIALDAGARIFTVNRPALIVCCDVYQRKPAAARMATPTMVVGTAMTTVLSVSPEDARANPPGIIGDTGGAVSAGAEGGGG